MAPWASASLPQVFGRRHQLAVLACACVLALLAYGYSRSGRSFIEVPDVLGSNRRVDIRLPPDYYDRPVADFYRPLIDRFFEPWNCLAPAASNTSLCRRPVTTAALSALEWIAKDNAYRIRYTGKDILYRPLQKFSANHKVSRMRWIMHMIREMADKGLLHQEVDGTSVPVRFDAIFWGADGPRITRDTLGPDAGYFLFALRTSRLHLDVPIPDPVAYGSNGNYVWPPRSELHTWDEKVDKLIFRGTAAYPFGVDNWQTNCRIRTVQLGQAYPHLIDAGITQYRPKAMPPVTSDDLVKQEAFFPVPSTTRIQELSNLTEASKVTFLERSGYKYILDVNGALGSSRRLGLLKSGSVPFFIDSPWFGTFMPLLRPWVHYVPVDESLVDLPAKIEWLQQHDDHARFIVRNAIAFTDAYASQDAAMEVFSLLLKRYTQLLAPDVKLDSSNVSMNYCDTAVGR
ncbi:hypothetical protein Rhopal_006345-T1 [Rhodotorula paludigena]|uniref:Glycosyl transferase CAP10 domain-containing protein n=1 Tax=Rhodotorula paludigena TaxID=86838 RepID=A0AAV5GST0_9BASI|nr:hypothetical protein Rhopal_006345-T1 [Rhodotorula paludigena]